MQVPHAPRDFWKQRSRWAKAAHLYILHPKSVFWRPQKHMTLYQKSLYLIPLMLHFTLVLAEPVMFTLPFICVVFNRCPYGIDLWLWGTHFLRLVITFIVSTHADSWAKRAAALHAHTSSRVLFFVNVKAVLNTLMVGVGWKRPGAFKETKKHAAAPQPLAEGIELPVARLAQDAWERSSSRVSSSSDESAPGTPGSPEVVSRCQARTAGAVAEGMRGDAAPQAIIESLPPSRPDSPVDDDVSRASSHNLRSQV